jgi:hypothetical protein
MEATGGGGGRGRGDEARHCRRSPFAERGSDKQTAYTYTRALTCRRAQLRVRVPSTRPKPLDEKLTCDVLRAARYDTKGRRKNPLN